MMKFFTFNSCAFKNIDRSRAMATAVSVADKARIYGPERIGLFRGMGNPHFQIFQKYGTVTSVRSERKDG